MKKTEWIGCGECDVAFPCHNGCERCHRNPAPVPVEGVVLRDGVPTLVRERDIKPTDVRLVQFIQQK